MIAGGGGILYLVDKGEGAIMGKTRNVWLIVKIKEFPKFPDAGAGCIW